MNDLMASLPFLLSGEINKVTDTALLDDEDWDFDTEFVSSLRFWDDDQDEEFWREDGFVLPDTSGDPIERASQDFSTFQEQETGSAAAFRAAESATQNKLGSDFFVRNMLARKGDEYEWGGTTKKTGYDCSGLIYRIMLNQGFKAFPRTSGEQYAHSKKISVKKAINTRGAILWHEGHIAVSLGNGKTIEAMGEDYGVVIGNAKGRFTGGGLLPELDMKQTIKRLQDRRKVKGQPTREAIPKRKPQNIDPGEVEVEDTTPVSTIPGVMMTLLGEPASQTVKVRERGATTQPNYGKLLRQAPKEFRDFFRMAANRSGVSLRLLLAVGAIETGGGSPKNIYNAEANSAGAVGPMQVIPKWHPGLKDPHNAKQNIIYAAGHLGGLIKWANGDVKQALAAYNAGSNNWQAGLGYAADVLDVFRSL